MSVKTSKILKGHLALPFFVFRESCHEKCLRKNHWPHLSKSTFAFPRRPPVKTNSSHLQIVVCKIKAGSNLYLTEMWIMYNVEQA